MPIFQTSGFEDGAPKARRAETERERVLGRRSCCLKFRQQEIVEAIANGNGVAGSTKHGLA